MPQMHLYVPKEVAREVRRRAEAAGSTVSKYLADLVKHEVADAWPDDYFEQVVGGWSGEPLERARQLETESRVPLV